MAATSRRSAGSKSNSIKSIKIPNDWEKVLNQAEVDYREKGRSCWTDEQVRTLKKYYGKVAHLILAKTIGVTVGKLKYKAEKLVSRGEFKIPQKEVI